MVIKWLIYFTKLDMNALKCKFFSVLPNSIFFWSDLFKWEYIVSFLSIEPSFWFVHLFSVVVPSYNEMRFFLLFGGAGAILISLVLCWAVDARVTRLRPLFEGTGVAISNFFDCVTGDGGVVVVVGIRSNSAIASWIAFSNCEFNFRPLQ